MPGLVKRFTDEEKAFILLNHTMLTAVEISEKLERSNDSVRTFLKKNKIKCKPDQVGGHPRIIRKPIKIERPPAIYTNRMSPYGIADELHRNPNSFCTI